MQMEGEQLSSEAAQALKQAVEGRPELAEQMRKLRPDEYREILAEASKNGGGGGAKSTLAAPVDKETVKVEANKEAEERAKKEAEERTEKGAEERAMKEAESSPIVCSSVEDAIKHIEGGAVSLE
jgi:hypothetical protein